MAEKTLEEFLQKEWDALCKKKKIAKPYPPINPENRAFALRLAAFVVREIVPTHFKMVGGMPFDDSFNAGYNSAAREIQEKAKALGISLKEG